MRFRFQAILNLRKHHEDLCRTRLYKEETKLMKIEEELTAWEEAKEEQKKTVATLSVGKIQPQLLAMGSENIAYLRRKKEETEIRRAVQKEQVALARADVIEARKGRKTLEKLKERFIANEKQKMMSAEQKRIDEVAVNLFSRDER
ncbi:MAG: hypothetical protein GX050_06360 [Firmicutes bacterium]|nr:hypothetical protein [Bacillota bacterium]